MTKFARLALAVAGLACAAPPSAVAQQKPSASPSQSTMTPPTFYRDVLPILQQHCQVCHRPGEIGPMPLLTYEQVRRFARAIAEATTSKKMPPWFADPSVG